MESGSGRAVAQLAHVTTLAMRVIAATISLVFAVAPVSAQFTPTPEPHGYRGSTQTQSYQGEFSDLANEIDRFWAATFRDEGISYESPNIFVVERETSTGCGTVRPETNAFYCAPDRTIYLIPQFLVDQDRQFGDYAPIAILSHEWGHHVQAMIGIVGPTRKDFELQADCLMGAFTRHADEQALLDYGDFLEALSSAIDAGDDVFLPEDFPGAHGMAEDRVKALTKGYGGGPVHGCDLPIGTAQPPMTPTSIPAVTPSVFPTQEVEVFGWPEPLPLNHSSCFRVEADHPTLTFDDLATRFGGSLEARNRLLNWGWSKSANRIYACASSPSGEAGWLDINLDLFESATSAWEAVDYFASVRAEGTWLTFADPPALGDHAAALSGPASNGKEFTIYVSQGPLLVRVTGVSPSGIPFMNVLTVAQAVLAAQQGTTSPVEVEQEAAPIYRASAYLPDFPAVNYAECFRVLDRGTYAYGDVVDQFARRGLSEPQIDGLGWQDGAYVVFTCAEPPFGRASQLDVVIHQFSDAQQALAYFGDTPDPLSRNEARACDSAGSLVVCVFGRSRTDSPLSDVHFVLNQVLANA